MLKVFSLIKRREDLSLDEFREWVFERHAPMGRELPGLREYHVSVIEQDDPDLPYHAVTDSTSTTRTPSRPRSPPTRAGRRARTWAATPRDGCAC